jgi:catechol 2,3-dioxygenase-like lactoylglutathione lyase family enzyme
MLHHISIRTADIHRSIAFYECLGFTVSERFTTGYTLACWLEGQNGRLEPDAFGDEHYVGYYHLSFDITDLASNLTTWLAQLEIAFQAVALPAPTILLAPAQQIIGINAYEVAFINDPDRLPIEFIHRYRSV